jgi:hypothetical protein
MGLLDDAIRDHLELKRRHGADPSEVAEQEQEALGPARREPPEAAAVAGGARAFDFEDEDVYDPRPGDEVAETTDEEEPVYDEDLIGEEDESPPDPDVAAGRPSGAVSSEVADVEPPTPARDAVPADEAPSADDVLEETPEFLQETPEHERLWFEQKPPRDFDF